MVYFPHFVLTLTSTSRASSGILQNRYPSKSQVAFSVLLSAILKFKIIVYYYSCQSFHFPFAFYSHSPSRLYQDFLCFNMMYTCNRSLLPNNFLTFNLYMSGITSIVSKCISLPFRTMWISSHLISNTSHMQFFLKVTFSKDCSPVNLN